MIYNLDLTKIHFQFPCWAHNNNTTQQHDATRNTAHLRRRAVCVGITIATESLAPQPESFAAANDNDNDRERERVREWPLSLHVSHAQESERQHTRERALLLCAGSAAVRAAGLDFRFCTHSNTKRVESEESAVCFKSDTGKQNQRD